MSQNCSKCLHEVILNSSLDDSIFVEANVFSGCYKLSRKATLVSHSMNPIENHISKYLSENEADGALLARILFDIPDLESFIRFFSLNPPSTYTDNDVNFYTSIILEISLNHELVNYLKLFDVHKHMCRIFASKNYRKTSIDASCQQIINDHLLGALQIFSLDKEVSKEISEYPNLIPCLLETISFPLLSEHSVFLLSSFQQNNTGDFNLSQLHNPISYILSLSPIQLVYASFYLYRPLEEANILGHAVDLIHLAVNGAYTLSAEAPSEKIIREHAVFVACGDIFIDRIMYLLDAMVLVTRLTSKFDEVPLSTSSNAIRVNSFAPVWHDWNIFADLLNKNSMSSGDDVLVSVCYRNIFPPFIIFLGNLIGGPFKDYFYRKLSNRNIITSVFNALKYIGDKSVTEASLNASTQLSRIVLFIMDTFIKNSKVHDQMYSQEELHEMQDGQLIDIPNINRTGILNFCLAEFMTLSDTDLRQNWYLSCLQIALRSGDDFDLYQFQKYGLIDFIVHKIIDHTSISSLFMRCSYDLLSEILIYKHNSFSYIETTFAHEQISQICRRTLYSANESAVFLRSLILSWNYFVHKKYECNFQFLNFILINKIRILRQLLFTISPDDLDVSKLCVFNTGLMFLYYLKYNTGVEVSTLLNEIFIVIRNEDRFILEKVCVHACMQMLEFQDIFYTTRPRDKILLESVTNTSFAKLEGIMDEIKVYLLSSYPEMSDDLLKYSLDERPFGVCINRSKYGDRFE